LIVTMSQKRYNSYISMLVFSRSVCDSIDIKVKDKNVTLENVPNSIDMRKGTHQRVE
jgi:hypothetical protein